MGKSIQINNGKIYIIRGIYADPLPNTDFQQQVVLAYSSLERAKDTNCGSVWRRNQSS